MKKISIVGVEGSGKTVLMSVLGERYARPDKNGLSLKAKKGETFAFCTSIVAALRKGQWPMATSPGEMSNLEWELLRHRGSSMPKVLGEVAMLDFAGEVYRQAFGMNNEVEDSCREDVDKLRNHVSQSDILVLLVNLKDVIDGDRTDQRTIDMLWLSQSILEFAKEHGVKDVALVLSQADRYKELVEHNGTVLDAFKRYLPHVVYAFPNIAVFAVSAVDGTRIDDTARDFVPACDFHSTGLDSLMKWIKDSIASKSVSLKKMFYSLVAIGIIVGGVWLINREKERTDRMAFLKTKQLAGYVIEISDQGESCARWKEGVEPPGNRNLITLKEEGTYRAKRLGYEWVPGTLTDRWKIGVEHETNSEIVSGENEGEWILPNKPGYSANIETFAVVWKAGLRHPRNKNLVSGKNEGEWESVRPGYKWIVGTESDYWASGLKHPGNKYLVSTEREGEWKSTRGEGWVWDGAAGEKWVVGIESVKNPHWVTVSNEEHPTDWWEPMPGYKKKNKNAEILSELVWVPGMIATVGDKEKKAARRPDCWLDKCRRCDGIGKQNCRICSGKGSIKCFRCEGSGLKEEERTEGCQSCRGEGYTAQRCNDLESESNLQNPYNIYYGKHVRRCKLCRGAGGIYTLWGSVPCQDCRGVGCFPCPTCDGGWTIKTKCDNCDYGVRKHREYVKCFLCKGNGTTDCSESRCEQGMVPCLRCGGDGWDKE